MAGDRPMTRLRVLDLFSGIGGFSLGLERTGGFETVAFCEIEEFPRKVLAKHWPDIPIHRDVRKLKGTDIGPVDVICGGYPCQPFSIAGQRRGKEDDRHLWPEFSRLVAELRPAWVIGENVAGHISMGLDDVLSDLEGQGYACRTFVIPACALDAPHRRDRVWTVAYADGGNDRRTPRQNEGKIQKERLHEWNENWIFSQSSEICAEAAMGHAPELPRDGGELDACVVRSDGGTREFGGTSGEKLVADTNDAGLQGGAEAGNLGRQRSRGNQQPERRADLPRATWLPEPDVGRVANGVPKRVDRLKALGNAVVPAIPEMIGRAILEAEAND